MSARSRRRAAQAIAVAIAALACAPAAQAYELDGIPWPGRTATITYWNGTAYGPQVQQAARAWNESGARVRFRRASRGRAQLLIVDDPRSAAGEDGLAHGSASVGYQPRNRIAIGRGARGVGVVGLIAHEFGHVLGLVHDDRRCAVMNSGFWSRCMPSPTCSILQADDVRGAIRRYGGRVRPRRAELCPPAPVALAVDRNAENGRLEAVVTLPPGGNVTGVLTRRAVGRCPERPTLVLEGSEGIPGSVVRVDVTPARTARRARGRHALRPRLDLRRDGSRERRAGDPAGRAGARGSVDLRCRSSGYGWRAALPMADSGRRSSDRSRDEDAVRCRVVRA